MTHKIKQLINQSIDLCIEINEETECCAHLDLGPTTVGLLIRSQKTLEGFERLFSSIILFDEDSIVDGITERDLKEFITFGQKLIKEQNPAQYKAMIQELTIDKINELTTADGRPFFCASATFQKNKPGVIHSLVGRVGKEEKKFQWNYKGHCSNNKPNYSLNYKEIKQGVS